MNERDHTAMHTINLDFVSVDPLTFADDIADLVRPYDGTVMNCEAVGPGGGWPNATVSFPSRDKLVAFAYMFADGDDIGDDIIESATIN